MNAIATILKMEEFTSKKGADFVKLTLFFDDGFASTFFLDPEKDSKMLEPLWEVRLARVLVTLRFYVNSAGEWRASILDVVFAKD